ncbi:MAG: hypothetical protein V4773_10440 [Verrucomicrobiota bacterium]
MKPSSIVPVPSLLRALLVLVAGALAGCATPGPLHVYSLARDRGEKSIADHREGQAAEAPSFLEEEDQLTGFAYDPFTDHFFLRLAPGNKIRVVDRPARAIKREYTAEGLTTGGDLALVPRSGHLFFLDGTPTRVVETSRFGKVVGTFPLEGVSSASGLACDPQKNQLLALHADGRQLSFHDLQGKRLSAITLSKAAAGSLALDAERGELYAPLREKAGVLGIFALDGKLLRELPLPAAFVDLGPRSFVRVF